MPIIFNDPRSCLLRELKHKADSVYLPFCERQIFILMIVLDGFINHLINDVDKAEDESERCNPTIKVVDANTLKRWVRDFTKNPNITDDEVEGLVKLMYCFQYVGKVDKTTYKINVMMYRLMRADLYCLTHPGDLTARWHVF
jgi:hypothetical protein